MGQKLMLNGFTKLTEEQRLQFRDEGYLIVRNVLDDESDRASAGSGR